MGDKTIRSIRCDFTPEEYEWIKTAAAQDDRAMKRFAERAILERAMTLTSELGRVPRTPPHPSPEAPAATQEPSP